MTDKEKAMWEAEVQRKYRKAKNERIKKEQWKRKKMNCLEIVKNYLADNGFDGLQHGDECACELTDLVPCDNDFSNCIPGYKVVPPEGVSCEFSFYICQNKNNKPWENDNAI